MKLKLYNVRLAFPNLFEPKQVKPTDKPKFSAAFLFPPDHPAVEEIKKAMAQVAKEEWGAKAKEVYNQLKASDRLALHDGAAKSQYAGYEGNLFINANNELRPLLLAADGRTPLDPQDGKIYPGAYVNAVIDIWPQNNQHGKRINAGLMGVQFAGHGDRLAGGGVAAEDDFEELPDVEDAGGVFDESDGGSAPPADEGDDAGLFD